MTVRRTEQLHQGAAGIDALPAAAILGRLLDAQIEAAAVVRSALPEIAAAAECAAGALAAGRRLGYAAAGSSGLMALADALELRGTFGIARDRVEVLLAGGVDCLHDMAGAPEDDAGLAVRDVRSARFSAGDCVLGVSASGGTPYVVAALKAARSDGATTIAMANNEDATLFAGADICILLPTPPEMIAGSTRLGAATAQKIALNLFSTLMAIRLGHVHDGHMVNVQAENAKLQARAARIVAAVGGCDEAAARRHLAASGGSVKTAVLLAAGAPDAAAAHGILEGAGFRLRPALSTMAEQKQSAHGTPQTGRTT